MQVSETNGVGMTAVNTTRNSIGGLAREDFMKLMLAQFRNQNPLNPISDAEFVGQVTQLSTLDNLEQLNKNFRELLLLQGLGQGANLIGKTIVFGSADSSQRGVVDSLAVQDGLIQLMVQGTPVSLSQILSVEA